ncbi:hypothetical protein A3765_07790 [Oleiphilus sp. HI0130]|nr:hypothetical protein A3765_07790 [Oleiphilus sp. HI0130]
MRLQSLRRLIIFLLLLVFGCIAIIVTAQIDAKNMENMRINAASLNTAEFQLIQEMQSINQASRRNFDKLNMLFERVVHDATWLVQHSAEYEPMVLDMLMSYTEELRWIVEDLKTNSAIKYNSTRYLAAELPSLFSLPGAKRLSIEERQYVQGYLIEPKLEGWQMTWHAVRLIEETIGELPEEIGRFARHLALYDRSIQKRRGEEKKLLEHLNGRFSSRLLSIEQAHFDQINTMGQFASVALAILVIGLMTWGFRVSISATKSKEELAEVNRNLDEKVKQATRQLQEQMVDLERQKLRAEDATKAKSEFLANMSHEIRTPLNGINGMAQILQRSGLNSDQRSQIETILTSTGSLTQIINDILDFSKIEAGKIEIERMDFSLLALIESAVDQVTMLANKSENQLVIQYSSRLPEYVNSDPSRIRQVMLNLLSNANKFTNGGVVEVRAEVMERMGDAYFKISIKDSGIGISEDKLAYIFEAFSQEDTSTTRKFGGTGLGLTICKRLAQLMGGDIAVTSTQGKGSRFSFFLPLIEADVPESEVRSGPLRHIKPMIFDNNEVRRRAMRNHLESWGLESVVFEDVSDFMLALQQLVGDRGLYADVSCIIADMDDYQQVLSEALGKLTKALPKLYLTPLYSEDFGEFDRAVFVKEVRSPIKPSEFLDALADAHSSSVGEEFKSEDEPTYNFDGRTILLVDDNEINRMVAELMLTNVSVNVVMAEDGRQAVDALQEQDFDLVFMDCQMPVMDGYEASRSIRQLAAPKKANVPIIAMTANAMKGDKEMCLNAGMDDYIAKPVDAQKLYALMGKWLGHIHGEGISARD